RAAGFISVEVCADDSMRGPPHRQMVSRQFLGDEQLVARDARPAGDHQPLQTDASAEEWRHPQRALSTRVSRARPGVAAGPGQNFTSQFFYLAGSLAQVRGGVCGARDSSVPQERAEEVREMDARTARKQARTGGDFPSDC